ncbi:hypothetical protein C8E97_1289 [Saccharothrix australiensis]|uniref:Uncharacterized protein n=1 Tax=Saccharothrix australiensis TaxID=2072 RepID=A0A495VTP1_9PSEU|nr:hypothetical protein C8E97_1289 [Saccharothrix australiensis]
MKLIEVVDIRQPFGDAPKKGSLIPPMTWLLDRLVINQSNGVKRQHDGLRTAVRKLNCHENPDYSTRFVDIPNLSDNFV